MRPLSDRVPKPLLEVGGKPLIVWQIEALARAGLTEIVINAAHLTDRLVSALGDGAAFGVRLRWSLEAEALETAGGIATAAPLLPDGPALIASGDIFTAFDYAPLVARAQAMACVATPPRVHLVMVPNPSYHPAGDFTLSKLPSSAASHSDPFARVGLPAAASDESGATCHTFGNIGVYDMALFRELPRGTKLKLLPFFERWIAAGIVSGELFRGRWVNVGTPDELASLDALLRHNDIANPT